MSDSLKDELASLRIDRDQGRGGGGGGALKALLWLAVLGSLGFAGYSYGLPELEARVFKPEVRATEIVVVTPGQAAVELTSTGYVVPQTVSRVGAKVPGRVATVHVREGDMVEQGALLIELERADRKAAIEAARMRAVAAEARVATAEANLAEARQQATRERALAERGVAPAARADDLEARVTSLQQAVKASRAEVRASEAEVKALKVDMNYTEVRAPIAGTVINKPPEVGELVGADLGSTSVSKVIELADFSTIRVETDIPEGRLHMVKVGSPCEIALDAFPKRRYRGEATEISPRVDRAKAPVGVKVKFVDAAQGVLPDMSARVNFLTEAREDEAMKAEPKTIVPGTALGERGGAKVVFAIDDGALRMHTVRVGAAASGGFELLEGPPAGTRVVSEPAPELRDGQQVQEEI